MVQYAISHRDTVPTMILFALLLLLASRNETATATPRGYLGLSVQAVAEPPVVLASAGGPYDLAAEVILILPGAAAERAGFETGDIIVRMDDAPFEKGAGDVAAQFRKRLEGRKLGETIEFLVLRRAAETEVLRDGREAGDARDVLGDLRAAIDGMKDGATLEVRARKEPRVLTIPATLGPHPLDLPPVRPLRGDDAIHPGFLSRTTPMEEFGRDAVRRFGLEADTADLERRLRDLHATDDGYRLDDVTFVHRNPWKIGPVAEDLLARLAPPGRRPDLPARIRAVAARDRFDLSGYSFPPLPRGVGAEAHAEALARLLAETAGLVDEAFAPLTAEERAALGRDWPGIGKAILQEGIYLHADPDAARRGRNLEVLRIAGKADRAKLCAAALSWARLADPAWLRAIRDDLSSDPRSGKAVILERKTPQGTIVFGGTARNTYRDSEPAIVVDLGGDDIYSSNAGSSAGPDRPAAAVVDLGGDDAYESTADGTQAAGILGVGLLVDDGGNDRYIGQDWSQGAGLLGIGILLDLQGDDSYRAPHLAQGIGLWGTGMVLDRAGRDRYEILGFGQGLGLPGGFGILQDSTGDDHYYAKGGFPTNYGTQGVFDAWAQGTGLGFRQLQSGGIGILADDAGCDGYEAGNFSQGGGYYFGWGLLHDRGPEGDEYVGSRYNMGFAAHQAVGTFLEDGGDDTYITRHAVIAGLAWDECVTLFEDRGGDDTYRAGGFSLGASAHNSFCFFLDAGGSDAYEGASPAQAGGNDYHGGTSLSLFLDLGTGRDRYEGGYAAGETKEAGDHGIFADLPNLRASTHRPTGRGPGGARP